MSIEREPSPEVIEAVLGSLPTSSSTGYAQLGKKIRTPLHVEYGSGPGVVSAEQIALPDMQDILHFNAVGSLLARPDSGHHLPVIDIDGGATLQDVKGSKVVLKALAQAEGEAMKFYEGTNLLLDVLGDNNIEAEILTRPALTSPSYTHYLGSEVSELVLRSEESDVFVVADSTTTGHSHLYIQQEFNDTDHRVLIESLGSIGMVGEDWLKVFEEERMGIVRTPWTRKQPPANR